MMIEIESNSQLSGMQYEEMMITKPKSRASDNSSEQQVSTCLCNEPKQLFDTSYSLDTKVGNIEKQERKSIEISEIIQILRTTKVQQCRLKYHHHGKFCAVGAILHEKYGWDGVNALQFNLSYRKLFTVLGRVGILNGIISLNDQGGKSFSEIADWLEKNHLNTTILNSSLSKRNVPVVSKKLVKSEVMIEALDRHIERLEAMLSFLKDTLYDPHNDLLHEHEKKVNAVQRQIHFAEKQRRMLKKLT